MSRLIAVLLLAATPAPASNPRRPPRRRPGAGPATRGPTAAGAAAAAGAVAGRRWRQDDLRDPRAEGRRVTLSSGEIDRLVPGRNKPFTKGDDGIWTLAVAPLPPGIYECSIVVDGLSMADPSSPNVVGNVRARGDGGSARPGRQAAPRRVAADRPRQPDPALVRLEGDADAAPDPRLHAAGYGTSTKKYRCSISCTAPVTTTRIGPSWAAPT